MTNVNSASPGVQLVVLEIWGGEREMVVRQGWMGVEEVVEVGQ